MGIHHPPENYPVGSSHVKEVGYPDWAPKSDFGDFRTEFCYWKNPPGTCMTGVAANPR